MSHEFVILVNGKLITYTKYEDIPDVFDNLIKFKPKQLDMPHTHEEHEEMNSWNQKLQNLMERERASRNKNR
jgi:hypothetical protein